MHGYQNPDGITPLCHGTTNPVCRRNLELCCCRLSVGGIHEVKRSPGDCDPKLQLKDMFLIEKPDKEGGC